MITLVLVNIETSKQRSIKSIVLESAQPIELKAGVEHSAHHHPWIELILAFQQVQPFIENFLGSIGSDVRSALVSIIVQAATSRNKTAESGENLFDKIISHSDPERVRITVISQDGTQVSLNVPKSDFDNLPNAALALSHLEQVSRELKVWPEGAGRIEVSVDAEAIVLQYPRGQKVESSRITLEMANQAWGNQKGSRED